MLDVRFSIPVPADPSRGVAAIRVRWLAALAILAALALWPRSAHAQITYVYDPDSRLHYMEDPAGNVTEYTYDSDGNLLAVDVSQPSGLAVYGLSQYSGMVGTQVSIYGFGFSATPSENTVTFNGTQATVTSSSATIIQTTVPTGASSGNVAVTAPSGNGSWPMFTVN